jgi:hypothetical protein
MKNILLFGFIFATAFPLISHAATLQQQLSDVAQAEQQGQSEEQARWEYYQQEREYHYEQYMKERNRRIAAANARAHAREVERLKDKARDQAYQDQLRQLQVEKGKLEVQQLAGRTQRNDEFLTQDLKKQAAETDVIQSQADANRDNAEGNKALMTSQGKALETKAGKWFN